MVGDLLLTNGYYLKLIWVTSQDLLVFTIVCTIPNSILREAGRIRKCISRANVLPLQGMLSCRCFLICVLVGF